MMAKNPRDRFRDAKELAAAFCQVQEEVSEPSGVSPVCGDAAQLIAKPLTHLLRAGTGTARMRRVSHGDRQDCVAALGQAGVRERRRAIAVERFSSINVAS